MKLEYAKYLLDKTKRDYNAAAQEFSNRRQHIWDEMKFLFDDYLAPGDKVLDLGCGNGRFFEVMRGKNVDYAGVDVSQKLIEIAKQRYLYPPQSRHNFKNVGGFGRARAKFQVGDALNLPFPDNFFDKVYSIATLHHIPSKELRCQFLKEAKRVLKPGGLLISTCWNLWQSSKKRKQIFKFAFLKLMGRSKLDFGDILIPFSGIAECYFHCFTQRELEKLAQKAGFRIKKSGKIIVAQETRPNSNLYIVAEK